MDAGAGSPFERRKESDSELRHLLRLPVIGVYVSIAQLWIRTGGHGFEGGPPNPANALGYAH